MKIISNYLKFLPFLIMVLGLQSCSDDDDATTMETTTVVDIAVDNNFTALASALQRANLVTTLEGSGPFTVFAPTNDAFQDLLDSNTAWNSIDDIPLDLLTTVLLNHVIVGSDIGSSTLIQAGSGYTTTGAVGLDNANLSLYWNADGGVVRLNGGSTTTAGANVTAPDIDADNGIVHVIDKVLLPPTIVDFAIANPALSNLVAALQSADSQDPSPNLISTLSGEGSFTVFAPANTAFEALLLELDPTGNTGLGDVPPSTVEAVLGMHVIGDNIRSTELPTTSTEVMTISMGTIQVDGSNLTITDPNDRVSNIVVSTPGLVDIQGTNGVVHVIDRVILPAQ